MFGFNALSEYPITQIFTVANIPAIVPTVIAGVLVRAIVETDINVQICGIRFNMDKRPILILRNPSASTISPRIIGSSATTVAVYGVGNVDVASGYAVGQIAAGEMIAIPLNTIYEFLKGAVTMIDSMGLMASLLEY